MKEGACRSCGRAPSPYDVSVTIDRELVESSPGEWVYAYREGGEQVGMCDQCFAAGRVDGLSTVEVEYFRKEFARGDNTAGTALDASAADSRRTFRSLRLAADGPPVGPGSRDVSEPPALLGGGHVLAYAVIDEKVRFTGRLSLFVGDNLLGAVPCLALTRDLKSGEIVLLHCNGSWDIIAYQPLGVGETDTADALAAGKARVERYYEGVSQVWVTHTSSRDDAVAMANEGHCSFCLRTVFDVQSIIEGREGVRICDICVRQCYGLLSQQHEG